MTNYERIFQELGELKGSMGEVRGIATQTLEQAKKTNGRVSKLEERMEGVDIKFAKEEGVAKGITISRGRAVTILTLVIAIAGVLVYFIK